MHAGVIPFTSFEVRSCSFNYASSCVHMPFLGILVSGYTGCPIEESKMKKACIIPEPPVRVLEYLSLTP